MSLELRESVEGVEVKVLQVAGGEVREDDGRHNLIAMLEAHPSLIRLKQTICCSTTDLWSLQSTISECKKLGG